MKKIYTLTILIISLLTSSQSWGLDVFWFEDFDNAAGTRWNVSGNDPTPAGIPGLTYGVNNNFDYFIINDANTPELDAPIANGLPISSQGQVVRGHHYDCSAPSNLPNPFVNTGALNNSLHITAQAGCGGLIYAGTPGYDDWNCLTISGNDFVLTQTEQFAAYNSNIDASGKCNLKLTADFFLGGSANGLEAHSTILYSIDGGATWKIVQDNLANCLHTFAGTCNDWSRRTFELPADANGEPDLRIAFRWTEDGNTNNNTQDYALGASFNVDNVMLSACSKPNADFISQAGTDVCKGQTAIFTSVTAVNPGIYLNCFTPLVDNCTITSYLWNITPATITYVDGTSAADANPHVQFNADGVYTVEMTVSTCGGDSVVTKNNFITVADCPPSANFIASNSLACADPAADQDTITFTDMSSTFAAPITNWNWTFTPATVTFVNGTSASDPNPQVVFDATGSYEVALQVTTAEGVDTETKTALVEAISCDCGGAAGGPSNLYSEDFTGGVGGFTLNSVEAGLGTTAGNENSWAVDNIYTNLFFGLPCALFPCTPDRGGGNYLHIFSAVAAANGASNALYNNLADNSKSFAKTPIINASGATGVSISFWMLNASTGTTGFAEVYYSIDGGANWISHTSYTGVSSWTFQTIVAAAFDNQSQLRFGFMFTDGSGGAAVDPAFSLDEISVDATGAAALPNTWEGTASIDWGTASNWSDGTVPVTTDDVLVPSAGDLVGTFMPTISAAAVAKNVCNYGTVTIIGNNTLTIDKDLLNEGVMTTDNVNTGADVIFANAVSKYRGGGTMYDVDVAVTSSDLTLENDISTRSLTIATAGTVDLATYNLRINKNLTKTAGTFIAVNGQIRLITACGTCVDGTSNADISMNANQAFGNVYVNKPAGVKASLLSAVDHSFAAPKSLIIRGGIFDANTNTLNGSGNLIMTTGELQIAKCATVVPELTGTYTLTGGQVTLDGVCDQTIRIGVAGGATTVFTEDFENPDIANSATIVGNIAGWTETGSSYNFINKETSGLIVQTATLSEPGGAFGTILETLTSPAINFGATTTNPQLTFDFEWVNATGDVPSLEVLYKSAIGDAWTVGATYALSGVHTANVVSLAGASSDFYIGFRVFFNDVMLGVSGGECSIDNIVVTADGTASTISYHDVEFTGTNIKTLDNGNLNINNQLFLSLPTTVGNYVNTATDTCFVYNSNTTSVVRTGGHIVGYLGRDINASDVYQYDVGSDNAGGDTYYEPIEVTTNSITGPTNIVAKFYDAAPNPTTVVNVTFSLNGVIDTIKQVETEGYWNLSENSPLIGGNYQASVSPSSFWTLSKPWAQGYYGLLKQDAVADPWDFLNGGIRSNDSTTTAFSNFSNYALAFADTTIIEPAFLPIALVKFEGEKTTQGNLLTWTTEEEIDNDYFELQRSSDGVNFYTIGTVDGIGSSSVLQDYEYLDAQPINGWNYYRLKDVNIYGDYEYSHIVALDNRREDVALRLLPNPATDRFTFDYIGVDISADFMVQIIDVSGRRLIEQEYSPSNNRVRETVNIKDLSSGVYFVQFTNGFVRTSRKLIIVD